MTYNGVMVIILHFFRRIR